MLRCFLTTNKFRLIVGVIGVAFVYILSTLTNISPVNAMAFIGFAAAVDSFAKELIINIIVKQNKGLVERVLKAVEDKDDK